jgi:hypothetical protein
MRRIRRGVRHLEKVKVIKSNKHQLTPKTDVSISANFAEFPENINTVLGSGGAPWPQ